jgi:hypothetical protein
MNKEMNDKQLPEMSDMELEDVVSVLLGVAPEGDSDREEGSEESTD